MCFANVAWLGLEEEVMADPSRCIQPSLLSLTGPHSFGPLPASALQASWPANLIGALRHPRVMTLTVAPEHFCDRKVIVKALICTCVRAWAHGRVLLELCCLTPCGLVCLML